MIWQQNKEILRTPSKSDLWDLWFLGHLLSDVKTWPNQQKIMTMKNTFREHLQRAIFENFDLWDIVQSDEKLWSDQQKDNNKDEDKYNDDNKYI